ncbi:MAG: DUF6512 family protein [Candidatus Nanoarchaeia archaeon]
MNIYFKAFLFLISFSIFHFGYELTGLGFLVPFFGINESVFQHLKMAFWGYLLLSIVEYFLLKKKIKQGIINFWYSRIFTAIIIPWIVGFMWYLLPAVYGRAESLIIDLIWAVAITYLSGLFVIVIEKDIEKIQFSHRTKVVLFMILIISAFLFVGFTYKPPWIDLFIDPEAL